MTGEDDLTDGPQGVTRGDGPCTLRSMGTQLLTVNEVADLFRVSSMTVYRLIRSGELPAVRVGRSYRVREDDLDAYLQAQVVDPQDMDLPDASEG